MREVAFFNNKAIHFVFIFFFPSNSSIRLRRNLLRCLYGVIFLDVTSVSRIACDEDMFIEASRGASLSLDRSKSCDVMSIKKALFLRVILHVSEE